MKPEAASLGLGSETCVWAGPACRECALGPVTVEAGEAGSKALAPCPTQHRAASGSIGQPWRGVLRLQQREEAKEPRFWIGPGLLCPCAVSACANEDRVGPKASQGSAAQPHPLYP